MIGKWLVYSGGYAKNKSSKEDHQFLFVFWEEIERKNMGLCGWGGKENLEGVGGGDHDQNMFYEKKISFPWRIK